MNYTDQQFDALAKYEESFRSAIDSNYYDHNPGPSALKEIRAAYMSTGPGRWIAEDYGCSTCIIRLLRKAGRLWFEDRDARIAAANDAEAAKLSAAAASEPATAPSTPAPDTNATQTATAAKTAPKSKTPKK